MTDDAEATFETIIGALKTLDDHRAFRGPDRSSDEATVDGAVVS